jgi:hypothetical protein
MNRTPLSHARVALSVLYCQPVVTYCQPVAATTYVAPPEVQVPVCTCQTCNRCCYSTCSYGSYCNTPQFGSWYNSSHYSGSSKGVSKK